MKRILLALALIALATISHAQPVVIDSAGGQRAAAMTGSGTATSATTIWQINNPAGLDNLSYQFTAAGSGGVQLEGSWDNGVTWTMIAAARVDADVAAATQYVPSVGAVFQAVQTAPLMRLRIYSYTSGTFTSSYALVDGTAHTRSVVQGGQGSAAAAWFTRLVPQASGGLTGARIQSAASTNATSVKASAGMVYMIDVGNSGAGAAWLKLYNKASAPTVGTDTPIASIFLPPGAARTISTADMGLVFSLGVAYAITGAAADADTTAVTAGQVTGVMGFN